MQLTARVAIQLWIVLFIVFFGAEVVHQEPLLRVLSQVLFGLPLAVWALLRLRGVESWLDLAIGLALGAFALVAILGRDPIGSLETLALALAYALLFRAARSAVVRSEWRERVALAAATGFAVTLALNAWLLISEKLALLQAGLGPPPLEGTQVFPWETVNAMPILVLVAIPFLAWSPPGTVRKLLISAVAVSAVIVVPISAGRAGWLGLATAAVLFGAFRMLPGWPPATWPVRARVVVMGVAGIGLVGAVVASVPLVDGLAQSGRLLLWEQSLVMIADNPLLGSGPGAYSWARLEYGPPEARLLAVRLTHDVPLQTLVDGGLLLAAAFSTVIAAWAWLAWSHRASLGRAGQLGIATLAGVGLASFLDDFSFLPAVMAAVVLIAAFSLPAPLSVNARLRFGHRAPLAVAALLALISVPAVLAADVARWEALAGRTAALRGDWPGAATHFQAAATAHGGLGLYWIELGLARSELGDEAAASEAYLAAEERSPGDPRPPGALAALSDDREMRLALLRVAADLSVGDPQYAYRLGLALADAGQLADGADAWARAVALRPELIGTLPTRDAGLSPDAVAERALQHIATFPRPDETANLFATWDIGLYRGQVPADAGLPWRAVEAARGGDLTAARALAEMATDAAPLDARSWSALAYVARAQCDTEAADAALANAAAAPNAWSADPPATSTRREFVYRETTLGAMQPPAARELPGVERWPISLVGPPPGCEA